MRTASYEILASYRSIEGRAKARPSRFFYGSAEVRAGDIGRGARPGMHVERVAAGRELRDRRSDDLRAAPAAEGPLTERQARECAAPAGVQVHRLRGIGR